MSGFLGFRFEFGFHKTMDLGNSCNSGGVSFCHNSCTRSYKYFDSSSAALSLYSLSCGSSISAPKMASFFPSIKATFNFIPKSSSFSKEEDA